MTILLTRGDLLKQDDVGAIVNTVNCVGVMGKGIALQFRNKWPENYRAYAAACKAQEVRPGRMFVFDSGALVAILKVLNTYRALDYGLSKIEVQKLAYFLQEAGEVLNLSFAKNEYGPYSDTLRHVLNRMEGHFIRGLGDGVVEPEIEPVPEALAESRSLRRGQRP